MTNEDRFNRIFEDLGEIKATSIATLEQAKKTNGRVTALETWQEEVKVKVAYQKGYTKGRITILVILAGALGAFIYQGVVPIIAAYIQTGKF